MISEKCELKLSWASTDAAKFACTRWHYSGCLPSGKLVKIGAWEDGRFIGCIIFGRGSSPYLGHRYSLEQTECVELTRIALTRHISPVSRIVSISLRMLSKFSPGVRLVVSFASQDAGHHGGIYQAGNWIYSGLTNNAPEYFYRGKRSTDRTVSQLCVNNRTNKTEMVRRGVLVELTTSPKHRYLMPMDRDMRKAVSQLSKPYPKRTKPSSEASGFQPEEGGAIPTRALQANE